MTIENGPFKDQLTRDIGANLNVCHFNIEGISRDKCEVLSKLMSNERLDVIALQETHTVDDNDLRKRGFIPGYLLLGSIHHKQYGITTYVKEDLEDVETVSKSISENIFILITRVNEVNITNIYKPPNESWSSPPIKVLKHPAIYVGDFNSHSTAWGYNDNDNNGDVLSEWITLNNLYLVYSSKDKGTFFSARWQKEYTPDLSIISRTSLSDNTMATRQVMRDFPHSQHRPVIIKYVLQIPMVRSIPKPRWNFRRANWKQYAREVDHLLQWIPPVANNYERFIGVIKTVAKKHIPRGFRKTFIPTWDKDCEQLFEDYQKTRDYEIADKMLKTLNNNRKQRWQDTVEKLDFTRSSHKAWGLGAYEKTRRQKYKNNTTNKNYQTRRYCV